jgi:uncharacterized protein
MNAKTFGIAMLSLLVSQYCLPQNGLPMADTGHYTIRDNILIRTKDGGTLSAVVVRKKDAEKRLPTALFFSIYSNLERSLYEAKYAADHGYIGMVADTRGKRLSPDIVEPYEREARDVNTVIDWIVQQPWSDGRVGMYGGSYSGFVQWAATKYGNPALKTIVPYVAAIPGQGLPMENNVFLTANYQWAFYVTDNKYTDDTLYKENDRWRSMRNNWWESGAAYNKIDSIDGTPNPWLQKWLAHPDYDAYWQSMVPYKEEFARINIPVLTITGYYDDGQVSALGYLREHYKYNPRANHYLIIGPYDHFGAQRGGEPELRGYHVDPVALISTREITFQWFDYILKSGEKPALLRDKINFEVMGANVWKHAPSMDKMESSTLRLYLYTPGKGKEYGLSAVKSEKPGFIRQTVDLADRNTFHNDYYPDPIIKTAIDTNGLVFVSQPFDNVASVSGMLQGILKAKINKKDMDIGMVLYELKPNGEYFQLSYYLGRASYARDMSRRQLLTPGNWETIPIERSRVFSKQLEKGSRLVMVLDIDKNPFAQINYGTGRDVSFETVRDAGAPLKIEWSTDSFIELGITR